MEARRPLRRSANPPLNYASPGVGSTGHAAGALITQVLGVEMEHVPYRGTGPAMNDVVAGRIQVFTNALAPMQSQIQAGTVREQARFLNMLRFLGNELRIPLVSSAVGQFEGQVAGVQQVRLVRVIESGEAGHCVDAGRNVELVKTADAAAG